MKNVVFLAATLIMPSLALANIFEVTDNAEGIPDIEVIAPPSLTEVPEIGSMTNEGFSCAQLWSGMDGYKVFEGRGASGGKIVSHDGPDTYIAYIVSGHGVMGNDAPDGTLVSRFEFGPGDVIAFGPGTMHHWINGGEELIFIGFQRLDLNADN